MTKKNEIANIDEMLEQRALAMKTALASEQPSTKISTKGGMFKMPNGKVLGDSFKAVIIGYAYENAYFVGAYNAKAVQKPVCSAVALFAEGKSALVPRANAEKPQSTDCDSCEKNAWGSRGDGSNAKACKNGITAAVVLPGDTNVYTMSISPTAMKPWFKAIDAINDQYGHHIKALSTFKFDSSTGFSVVVISTAEANPDYKAHSGLMDAAEARLVA